MDKATVELELKDFLGAQPSNWLTPQHELTYAERKQRLKFGEAYISDFVRGWLAERNMGVADLVDSERHLSRDEFVSLICALEHGD